MTKITLTHRNKNGEGSGSSSSPILQKGAEGGSGDPGSSDEAEVTLKQRTTRRSKPLAKGTIKSGNEDYIDSQFEKPPARIPTRSITLAVLLCFGGSVLLTLGIMVLTGQLDAKYEDRVWPMMIMGFLMFIPGAYHVRLFLCALKGIPGYSFEDIPEFE